VDSFNRRAQLFVSFGESVAANASCGASSRFARINEIPGRLARRPAPAVQRLGVLDSSTY
jgi:hypothetical protein